MRSRDSRQALVLGRAPGDEDDVREATEGLAERYAGTHGPVTVGVGGTGEVFNQIEVQAEKDLKQAELLTFPITVVLLVVVFGSVVAAGLPLAVGAVAVVGTFVVLRLVTAFTDVSIFALNLTTAMGLGLAIDYSLFVVSRYREELRHGDRPDQAVTRCLHTAGRTVAFSALTVAVSLAALAVFPLPFLRSFAFAGVGVVLLAAAGAVVVLPALLAVIGRRIDLLTLFHRKPRPVEAGFWYRRAPAVMRRPISVAVAVTAVLVALGIPFADLELGLSDDRVLPAGAPVRRIGDDIRRNFSSRGAGALAVVAPEADLPTQQDEVHRYAAADLHHLRRGPGRRRHRASTAEGPGSSPPTSCRSASPAPVGGPGCRSSPPSNRSLPPAKRW